MSYRRPAGGTSPGLDLRLQLVEPDRADDDFVADHVARRAVDAERVGKLHVLVDRRLHLVAVHVLFDARHVEADFLGDGERARLVGRAAAAEELLVELDVFLAGRILHARGDRDVGGLDRALAEHREFLEHEFEIRIGAQEAHHVGQRALAEAAIVVEELDHRDIALRIAEHDLVRRIEHGGVVVLDRRARLVGVGLLLPLVERVHRFLNHFGMRDEVVLDDDSRSPAADRREKSASPALSAAGLVLPAPCAGTGVAAVSADGGLSAARQRLPRPSWQRAPESGSLRSDFSLGLSC